MDTQICPILERDTECRETPYSVADWRVVQCQETGFVYLANPPSYERLEEEFAWEKTVEVERERRDESEPVVRVISTTLKTTKQKIQPTRNKIYDLLKAQLASTPGKENLNIVDVGCGSGLLLVEVCDRLAKVNIQVKPLGIEVSTELARMANDNYAPYGGSVVHASAIDGLAQLPVASTDFFLLRSFLEHESQPLKLLRAAKQALHPDGAIILKVPNFDCWNRRLRGRKWCGFRYPDHVNYFTPSTLRTLTEQAGLEVARQSLFERLPTSDNMYAVLSHKRT